jgi:predicted RNA-binding Zn ribbon-like protein
MDRQPPSGDGAGSRFVFLAGDIALDFVNTVLVEGRDLVDRVSSPTELAAWVAASSLGTAFGEPVAIPQSVHARALGLRRALKVSLDAVVAGKRIPDHALGVVNGVLRADPGSELVHGTAGGLRRRPRVDLHRDPAPLPWLLADAGARLLGGDRVRYLRRCANHNTCVLMFLDTSRSRTRRWCSMEPCGNRNKVAAHSARARRQPEGGSSR